MVAVPSISSIYQNPAGISFLEASHIALAYHKTLPVEGFSTLGFWGNYKSKIVDLGFSADNFGDQYYHESRIGLAASKKLDKVSMGLKFSLLNNAVKDISSKQTVLGEFGIHAYPSRFFSIGLHVINFTSARLYASQSLPTYVNFGIGLNPSKKVNISGQMDYPVGQKPNLKVGMAYQIKDELRLSTGVNPSLRAVHFGLGYDIKKYKFSYAVSTHPNIGLSNHLTLALQIDGKK
ncbi:hypothetical protein EGI22_03405 [Lacihabitans sp. LS3-19]|uniref:hypothetical protein n=1 Tax=Lacihabitans sp. LS3-19 TaxID=2487335 RepID=UPI0020CED56E|nr:hypothetical protein [Lacihabitans sp. LS3-19]MCP9766941.1 hypothetical protein [Lacihabitans sp. LS3-19]